MRRRDNPRSPTLAGLVNLFLAERSATGLVSDAKAAEYRRILEGFAATPGMAETARELDRSHLLEYTLTLTHRPKGQRALKPSTVHTYQQAVWTFCRWLYHTGEADHDVGARVPKYRVEEASVTRRTAERSNVDALIANIHRNETENEHRDVAVIEMMWSTGLRRHEVALLQFGDVDMEEGYVALSRGKGGKRRTIGIGRDALLALLRYLELKRGYEPGPLFLSSREGGAAMSSNAIRLMLLVAAKRARVTLAAHDLRRAAAVNMLGSGMALEHVARQLGHSTLTQSLMYAEAGRTERAIAAFHQADAGVRKIKPKAG